MKMLSVILTLGWFVVASSANAELPSKQADSDSNNAAHKEMERLTGLSEQQQFDRFVCQSWYYTSLSDKSNFAELNEQDREEIRKVVGDRAFFLHRFTPKQKGGSIYEIFVSKDGMTVYGTRTKPRKRQK